MPYLHANLFLESSLKLHALGDLWEGGRRLGSFSPFLTDTNIEKGDSQERAAAASLNQQPFLCVCCN